MKRSFCINCGNKISSSNKYCPRCGILLKHQRNKTESRYEQKETRTNPERKKARTNPEWKASNSTKTKKKAKPLKVISIFFAIIILLGVIFSIRDNAIKESDVIRAVNKSYQISEEDRSYADSYSPAELSVLISDRVSYEVVDYNSNSATLSITAPNMRDLFSQVASTDAEYEDSSEEAARIEEYVKSALISGNYTTVTTTVIVGLTESTGTYEIVPTQEYTDAILGGMISYYNEIMSEGRIVD